MIQREKATKQSDIWPVAFPDERLIVKRPSLRHICQGNADLGELLSYFLYEVSKDAMKQGINPQALWAATLYRTQENVLDGIDHSMSRKALSYNTCKLEQLGFLKALSQQHAYTVLVENIRQALALYPQKQEKKSQTKLKLPSAEVYLTEHSFRNGDHHADAHCVKVPMNCVDVHNDCVKVPMNCVDVHNDCVKVPMNCVDVHNAMGKPTQSYIDPAATPQAAPMGVMDDPRYNRYYKVIYHFRLPYPLQSLYRLIYKILLQRTAEIDISIYIRWLQNCLFDHLERDALRYWLTGPSSAS